MRTVLKRCDTSIVMRPSGVSAATGCSPAARRRSVALEQRVLGLGVERRGRFIQHEQQRLIAHETARERKFLPLAKTHLDTIRPRRPKLRFEPFDQPLDDVGCAGAVDRGNDGRFVVEPRHIANADTMAHTELEAEKVLERAG